MIVIVMMMEEQVMTIAMDHNFEGYVLVRDDSCGYGFVVAAVVHVVVETILVVVAMTFLLLDGVVVLTVLMGVLLS